MKPRSMFSVLSCLVFVLCVGLGNSSAQASPPSEERIVGSYTFVDASTCVDPVQVTSSYDEVMHIYFDSVGSTTRLAFTGTVSVSYVDLVTGARYAPNSSGPATVNLTSGTVVARGGNGAVFTADGELVATDGRVLYDAAGNVVHVDGRQTPVCAALGTVPAP